MLGFERTRGYDSVINGKLNKGELELTATQNARYNYIRRCWDFFEGYHWEDMPPSEGVQHTVNYCKAFINRYVAFELGDGFTFNTSDAMNDVKVTPEGKTNFDYLESVWLDNDKDILLNEIGQMKDVSGEAWVQVHFAPEGSFPDPFNIYTTGRIELLLLPTICVYPDWNPHKRGELQRLLITYRYQKITVNPITLKHTEKSALYKQIWTADKIIVNDDGEEKTYVNKYGIIPIIPIKNLPYAGREQGTSDLDDLIPINTAYNMKASDISEIIDYHAAPITVVTGGKIGNLEKGANRVWGGLPKGATVSNLELKGDLGASMNFMKELKKSMCEVGSMPESALGGAEHISNTSGVALHIAQAPLVNLTKNKRAATKRGLELINRMILYVSVLEGLIERGDVNKISNEDFYFTEVDVPDTMPKDILIELQAIAKEMMLGLEGRRGALKRLGTADIEEKLNEIDTERKQYPEIFFGLSSEDLKSVQVLGEINSGITNGQTSQEEVNKEMTGQNKSTSATKV